jgi:hypothetical protein
MNFHPTNPDVKEMKGIMNAYRGILNVVELSGPTLFSPMLTKVVEMAENTRVS